MSSCRRYVVACGSSGRLGGKEEGAGLIFLQPLCPPCMHRPHFPYITTQQGITTQQSKTIMLKLERNTLIESVRQMIQEKENISPDQQRLFFGRVLKNGGTLSDYHVSSGSTLHLVMFTHAGMQTFVKRLNDKPVTLALETSDTALNLKQIIHDSTGIPIEHQSLLLKREELEDDWALFYYNIQHRSSLYLAIR